MTAFDLRAHDRAAGLTAKGEFHGDEGTRRGIVFEANEKVNDINFFLTVTAAERAAGK
jgi:hypothetical protein